MKQEKSFFVTVCQLAVPVALQSMLQTSFSIIDQIMIGQLGSVSVAGVGLAGKFAWIFSVVASAVGAVAGIMISQYIGQNNRKEVRRSFFINVLLVAGFAAAFTISCLLFPQQIMCLYTNDPKTLHAAAAYLFIISGTFFPMAGATLLAVWFRCMEKADLPLYASIAAAFLNTGLNYMLIFGKCGAPEMGANGAAVATVASQLANFLIMLFMLGRHHEWIVKAKEEYVQERNAVKAKETVQRESFNWKQYVSMLLPILVSEVMWSLGENIYAAIYGHMGTRASAAMILINPVQGLMIGALCGLSQVAGILIGKKLGEGEYEEAYRDSKKLILYGFVGSFVLSAAVILTSGAYVEIYRVEDGVKQLTEQVLFAYALIAPFKVQNMIVGGGILRSGGKTKYVLGIDLVGTWLFGVPLGLLAAFVFKLSVPYVYFLLSLEECIRYAISVAVLRRKNWMQQLS